MSEPREKLDIGDLKDNFLECPVCVEHFNQTDRRPRLLHSCLHAFCTQCLHQLLVKEGKGHITCPLCRQVQMVIGKIDTLPLDPVRSKLVEYVQIKHKKEVQCTDCPDKNIAEERCGECAMNLCHECVRAHRRTRMTKDHKVSSLEEIARKGFKTFTEGQFCSVHPKHQVEFYCPSCDKLCCVSCTIVEHKTHELVPITEAASSKMCEWEAQIRNVSNSAKRMRALCGDLDKEKEKVASFESETVTSIDRLFHSLLKQVNRKKEVLLENVRRHSSVTVQAITKQKESAEDRLAVAESVTGYFTQMKTRASDYEILQAAPALERSLSTLCKEEMVTDVVSGDTYRFVPASQSAIDKFLQAMGKIETTKHEVKNEDPSNDILPVPTTGLTKEGENRGLVAWTGHGLCSPNDGGIYRFDVPGDIQIKIYHGNIVKVKTDVIVNAANPELQNYAGMAGAIEKACGRAMKRECDKHVLINGPLKVSEVMHTTAGDLKYLQGTKYIMHTVGPVHVATLEKKCGNKLTCTFLRCLDYGRKKLYIQSIAFPFISTGVFGVPLDTCVESFLDAVVMFSHSHQSDPGVTEIHLVNTDLEMAQTAIVMIRQHLEQGFDILVAKAESRLQNKGSHGDADARASRSERKGQKSASSVRRSSSLTRGATRTPHDDVQSRTYCHRNSRDFKALQTNTLGNNSPRNKPLRATSSIAGADVDVDTKETYKLQMYHHMDEERFHCLLADIGRTTGSNDDNCSICMDRIENPYKLKNCGHEFCRDCIAQAFQTKPVCPVCGKLYGAVTGDQPRGGKMAHTIHSDLDVPGHRDARGAIVIQYSFPGGIQLEHHPNPGKKYSGIARTAYLPNNREGREVLRLLERAFDAGVTFTIGESRITGQQGVITWNDIHHKTSLNGGPTNCGFPEGSYLKRVKEELAAKGITNTE